MSLRSFFLFLSFCLLVQPPASGQAAGADQARLEVIEELSESLANDMLDLSVAIRDYNQQQTELFFPEHFQAAPFLARPGELQPGIKWIARRSWQPSPGKDSSGALSQVARADFVGDWFAFFSHFSEIEDARVKVKDARFDESAQAVLGAKTPTAVPGASGQARLYIYVVGRDPEGRREWARGNAEVRVRYNGSRWQFERFRILNMESLVATTEMFSEVAMPAGVALSRPPRSGQPSFVWHGAAAADLNNDGWLDIFVTGPLHSILYLNRGDGTFRDATKEIGLEALPSGVAPLAFDYDNDGDLDLFISNVGSQVLLESRLAQDGRLEFRDVSARSGVAAVAVGFSVAAADVTGDGYLDLYVTGYNHYGRVVPNSWVRATNGTRNLLFINQGDGTFREQASRWGVEDRRWSYAAAFADLDGDHRPDLYVANDFGENALFMHRGDRFVDEAKERGVLDTGAGMGVSFGDYNNDGVLDLHVSNMSSTAGNRILGRLFPDATSGSNLLKKLAAGNNLYQGVGDGTFRDVTDHAGPFSGGWAWGGGFLDFDNDGWQDLYAAAGFISGKSMKDT